MPGPVRHGVAGERLEPGAVGAKTELAITDGKPMAHVIQLDVMPRHQRVPVNLDLDLRRTVGVKCARWCEQQGGKEREDEFHVCSFRFHLIRQFQSLEVIVT